MYKIAIIRETRSDDKRTPLVPAHIKELLSKFLDLRIFVQPSKHRCFSDQEYEEKGAIITEDLSACNLVLGVKEIEPDLLIPSKKYMFFSHTSKIQPDNSAAAQGTPGMDKKELLIEILKKKITLIDYENIRDGLSRRYLGFGRFAGIVGCYNSLNLYLETLGQKPMPRAHELNSYEKLKDNISKRNFGNARIIITGDGRVARGSLELLEFANIQKVLPDEYLQNNNSSAIFCNLTTSEYVSNKDKSVFDLQHFINFPEMYISVLDKYMPSTSMLISSHYWDPKSPRLFEKKNIEKNYNLKVIGDITCDVNGSIPTTSRSSTIIDPYYYVDRTTLQEIKQHNKALAVMAVDNLPSELPKDSSKEFGDGIVKEVLPYILKKDDGRIKRATIAESGCFLPSYKYLTNYINAK
ncbi:NAD(P)-dependent oxidoreductase [Alphaproteobacteria bacterium]|nr:NAD(P)-dependent oxidoreductase [Alphaproteobacteria bacterium]